MRVAVIGAGGQLGSDLLKLAGDRDVIGLTHADLDVTDRKAVSRLRADVIVNCAAYVNVDEAETHRKEAFAVNVDGVRNLAETGIPVVYVSTDYVFNGASPKPYVEEDAPDPRNVYGESKLAGEKFAGLVVRSSGLYGLAATRAKGNFVRTMLRLGRERDTVSVVTDQVSTPTNSADLARVMWQLVDAGATGVYHATNAGECSWFEFAQAIFELVGMDVAVKPTDSARLGLKARRPAYSVLSNAKLERDGFGPLRPWREALASHLESLAPLT